MISQINLRKRHCFITNPKAALLSEASWPFPTPQVVFFPRSFEMSCVLLPKVPQRKSRKSGGSSHPSFPFLLWVGCANLLLLGTASCTYGMFLEEMCLHLWELTRGGAGTSLRPSLSEPEQRGNGSSGYQSTAPQIWLPLCVYRKTRMDLDVFDPDFSVTMLKCETLGEIWNFPCYI